MSTYYFVIVGHNDNPIYEKEFSTVNKELRVSIAKRERAGDGGFSTALFLLPHRRRITDISASL